jgi:hypothetical protein
MQVRDEQEGDVICGRLRAAGITCGYRPTVDRNQVRLFGAPPTVLMVFVHESDLEEARDVILRYESDPGTHEVSVNEIPPDSDDPTRFETSFVAVCACGWSGPWRTSSDEAFVDAHGHSANTSGDIVRASDPG